MRPVDSGSAIRIPSVSLPDRSHWPGSPGHPCTTGLWRSRRKRFGCDTGLIKSRPKTPFTEAARWPAPLRKKGAPWDGNAFRQPCGRWESKGCPPTPISARGTFNTGSIRICSGAWFPALPTMFGASMSRRSDFSTDGCICWRPSTGSRAMSSSGRWITPWRCSLSWTVWIGLSTSQPPRSGIVTREATSQAPAT